MRYRYKTITLQVQPGGFVAIDYQLPHDVRELVGVGVNVLGLPINRTANDMQFDDGGTLRDIAAYGEIVLTSPADAAYFRHIYDFNRDNYNDQVDADDTRYGSNAFMPLEVGGLQRITGHVRDLSSTQEPRYYAYPTGYFVAITLQYTAP